MDTLTSIGVINLAEFVICTIAIVLLPGPNSLYVLATAAKRGVKPGFLAALGVLIGDTILMFAAATGATALLKAFPLELLYLIYESYQLRYAIFYERLYHIYAY
jgi:leucine efflux protein